MHSGHAEQREQMRQYLPFGVEFKEVKGNKWDWRIVRSKDCPVPHNPLGRLTDRLGLTSNESHERFIPDDYLLGSIKQRMDLLQGLFDNDGCISKDGHVIEYNTTSPVLARQVVYLVRSLGGVAWVTTRIPKFTHKGVKKEGRRDHRIRVALDFCPFRVSWKKERWHPREKYAPSRAIVKVERVGSEECVCIRVDAPDHLYVTRDFVVTHNTVQALAAIRPDEGAVIVCPAFLMLNWAREAREFRPDLEVVSDVDLHRALPRPGQVFISAYSRLPIAENEGDKEQFPRWAGAEPTHPFTLILDEAHYVKSSSSQRSTRVRVFAQVASRVWALTGTPMINAPPELWALCQALSYSAKRIFGSWENFVRMFGGRQKHYGGYDWNGVVSPEVLQALESVMLRRTRMEVLPQLPKKTHRELVVPLSKRGRLGEDFSFIDSWPDERVEEEATQPQGALFTVRRELADAKHEALDDLIQSYEDAGEPLVVFGMHAAPIQALSLRPGWFSITGATPMEGREDAVRRFQDPSYGVRGIAGTVGAMGVGVTLTRAAHAAFVDRPWTPAEEDQAEDRICRIGQSRPVLITRLVADHPVDRRVQAVLERKRQLLKQVGLSGGGDHE